MSESPTHDEGGRARQSNGIDVPMLARSELPTRRHEKVSETVAREIIRDVIAREVQPGAMLPPELALANQYGVGRSSLREALRILEVPGIVQMRHGAHGGPMYTGGGASNLANVLSLFFAIENVTVGDLVEARRSIEPMSARLAAENPDPEVHRSLEALLERLGGSPDGGTPNGASAETWSEIKYSQESLGFHQTICASSGNRLLNLLSQAIIGLLDQILIDLGYERSLNPEIRREVDLVHRRTLEAILRGDGREAERLTAAHHEAHERILRAEAPDLWKRPISWM